MRASLESYERAEHYVLGRLSEAEAEQFLRDPEAAELIAFQELLIRASERQGLRREIKQVSAGFHEGGRSRVSWLIGSVILLGLAIPVILFNRAHESVNVAEKQTVPLADTSVRTGQHAAPTSIYLAQHSRRQSTQPLQAATQRAFEHAPADSLTLIQTPQPLQKPVEKENCFLMLTSLDSLNFVPDSFTAYVERAYRNEMLWNGNAQAKTMYYFLSRNKNRPEPTEFLHLGDHSNPLSTSSLGIFQKFTLVDLQNEPLEGIRVNVKNDPSRQVITDETGSFEITRAFQHKETYIFDFHREDGLLIRCQVTCNARKRMVIQVNFEEAGTPEFAPCSIEPMYVRALYQPAFAQTFVATRNFEERLQLMHRLPEGEALLKLYIRNIDQPLCSVDSLAAAQLSGESSQRFYAFAAEGYTTVNYPPAETKALYDYFLSEGSKAPGVHEVPIRIELSLSSEKRSFLSLFKHRRSKEMILGGLGGDPRLEQLVRILTNCRSSITP